MGVRYLQHLAQLGISTIYTTYCFLSRPRGWRDRVGSTRAGRRATRVIKMIHSTVVCMSVSYYCSSFRCGLFLSPLPACLLFSSSSSCSSTPWCHTPCFIRLLKGNEAKQKTFSLIGQLRISQQHQISTRKTVISYTAFEYFIYITSVKFTLSQLF